MNLSVFILRQVPKNNIWTKYTIMCFIKSTFIGF